MSVNDKDDVAQGIGDYIYHYRLIFGLTQEQLGIIITASQSQVSRWEHGVNKPTKLRLEEIMRVLKNG